MDIDHINPKEKKFSVTKLRAGAVQILLEELKKCQTLCAACHRIKTLEEKLSKTYKNMNRGEIDKLERIYKKLYFDGEKKECRRCEQIKNVSEFSQSRGTYKTYCKSCYNIMNTERKEKAGKIVRKQAFYDGKVKECTKCKQIKDVSEFNKRKSFPNGLNSRCRDCTKEYFSNYRLKK